MYITSTYNFLDILKYLKDKQPVCIHCYDNDLFDEFEHLFLMFLATEGLNS